MAKTFRTLFLYFIGGRTSGIKAQIFFHFPSWKIQQGPLNVFPPLMFFPIPLSAGYDVDFLITELPKRVEEQLLQTLQCSGIHPALSHHPNMRSARQGARFPPEWAACSAWKQLLHKNYSSETSFWGLLIPSHCTVTMTTRGATVDRSINWIPLFWDSLLKHMWSSSKVSL